MNFDSSPSIELTPLDDLEPSSALDVRARPSETIELQLRSRHRTMLVLSILILVLSFILSIDGSGTESVAWWGIELPPLCGSRYWFNAECPGCGLTRSFVALAHLEFGQSFAFHRLGWLIWLAVVLQLPYRVYSLGELHYKTVQRRWPVWFGNFLIAALLGNWILKVLSI